ncbi:MAG: hypothetical protein EZS28_011321 [Streblomastix strix]|uniref:Ubiquitin-like domain-containing protein n=1 Tax=Streblomastix strix TaxID=222440 RepID=A0A5J4WF44_9EUKA|nr:MAG: hypothetical protein EZS28_011321 [Streblomastix strix]
MRKTEQLDGPSLVVQVEVWGIAQPVEVNVTSNTTVKMIKQKVVLLLDSQYTLFKGKKNLDNNQFAFALGVRNGDKLKLIDNSFIEKQITRLEHDFDKYQRELATQLTIDTDDIFCMDRPINRNLPSGFDEPNESGEQIDLELQSGEYQSLTPHEKIDLAYQKIISYSGHKIGPKIGPNTEKGREEAYFRKWTKIVEVYYDKQREPMYYLQNHQEILQPDFEFPDYDEEFDGDDAEEDGELLAIKKKEISDDEFMKPFHFYRDQLIIMSNKLQQVIQFGNPPVLNKAILLIYRAAALYPRIFLRKLQDHSLESIQLIKQSFLIESQIDLTKFMDNPVALSSLMRFRYFQYADLIHDSCVNKIEKNVDKFLQGQDIQTQPDMNDMNNSKMKSTEILKQQQSSQSSDISNSQIKGLNNIDVLQGEVLGVIQAAPIHLIHFVHSNLERYIPLFTDKKNLLFEYIRIWPHEFGSIINIQEIALPAFRKDKVTIFQAQQKSIQNTLSSFNAQDEQFEIRFNEEPGLVLTYNVSSADNTKNLQAEIVGKVNERLGGSQSGQRKNKKKKSFGRTRLVPKVEEIDGDDDQSMNKDKDQNPSGDVD